MVKIISKMIWVFAFCFFSMNALADRQDIYCDLGTDCTFHPHDEIALMGAINLGKTKNGNDNYDGQLKNGEYICHVIQKNASYSTRLHIQDDLYITSSYETAYLAAGEKYQTDVNFSIGKFINQDHNYLAFFVTPLTFNSIDSKTEVTVSCKKL